MKFAIKSTKLSGNPGNGGWTQIHEFTPEDEQKLLIRGKLFAVISASDASVGFEIVTTGREIISRLHEEYYGKIEKSAFVALKEAVDQVVSEFSHLSDLQIAAAAFVTPALYCSATHGAEVLVYRNQMLAKILHGVDNKNSSVSGYPKDGDIVILSTGDFVHILGEGVLKSALDGNQGDSAVESLTGKVHAREDSGKVGSIFLQFTELDSAPFGNKPEEKELDDVPETPRPAFKIPNFLVALARKLPDRRIQIKKSEGDIADNKKKRLAVTVGALLLLVLTISIGFGVRQKRINDEKANYDGKLTQAEHSLAEATGLYELNPARARELFVDARTIAKELESNGVKDERLTSLSKKLTEYTGKILGDYEAHPDLFVDLSLFIAGFKASDLAISDGKMAVLDIDGKRVVAVDLSTKKTEVVAGKESIGDPLSVASYSNRAFVLENRGIYEASDDGLLLIDKDWSGDVLVYAYSGNIYLLDREDSQIWRYPGIGRDFGERSSWLASGIEPDLSKVVSWTIDGSIWLLSESGRVAKFTQGVQQNFEARGINPPLVEPQALYTDEEQKDIYILDPKNARIVVLDKEGNYLAQYTSSEFADALDLAVSERGGKIIVLTQNKLLSVKIGHL